MTPLAWVAAAGRAVPPRERWERAARGALGGGEVRLLHAPAAAIAWTGGGERAAIRRGERLCLLDGVLDGAPRLARELGMPADAPAAELALEAWLRGGARGLERLDGDWVLVVLDGLGREGGVVARDRAGARAAFWARSDSGPALASEVAPLLALLPSRPGPDRVAMVQWLASEGLPEGRTLYAGVRRVLPGRLLRLGAGAGVREERWWRPVYRPPALGRDRDRSALAADTRERVAAMLRRRLDPERPSGLLLSAGLDSAGLAALAARERDDAVLGLNASFPALPAVDEGERVERLLRTLGARGLRARVGATGLLDGGLAHIERFGLPPVGWGDVWEQPLLRAAREAGCRVVLHGEGGDEAFGVRMFLVGDALRAGRPLRALRLAARLPGAAAASRRALLRGLVVDGARLAAPATLSRALRRARPEPVPSWLSPSSAALLRATTDPLAWRRLDGPLWWSWLAWVLTERVEALGALDHLRRRAAWSGLETRHPLLNPEAVDLALGLPPDATFDPRLDRIVFRDALAGVLPDDLRLRPDKSLFDDFVLANLASDRAAAAALLGPDARVASLCAPGAAAEVLARGPAERAHPFAWAQEALRLVMLECWLREQEKPGSAMRLREAGAFSSTHLNIEGIAPGSGGYGACRLTDARRVP